MSKDTNPNQPEPDGIPSTKNLTQSNDIEPVDEENSSLNVSKVSMSNTDDRHIATNIPATTSTNQLVSSKLASTNELSSETVSSKAKRDLENMVLKYAKSERDNLQNQKKVEDLEKKLQRAIKDNEQLTNRIKILINDRNHLNDTLSAKVAQLTVLESKKTQFDEIQVERLKETEAKLAQIEEKNESLVKKIDVFKTKEGELLDFSEMLSMKLMMLQSELDETIQRGPKYKEEYDKVAEENNRLNQVIANQKKELILLRNNLDLERAKNVKLEEVHHDSEAKFLKRIDELENEIKVTRRKYQISSKGLVREMNQMRQTMIPKDCIT